MTKKEFLLISHQTINIDFFHIIDSEIHEYIKFKEEYIVPKDVNEKELAKKYKNILIIIAFYALHASLPHQGRKSLISTKLQTSRQLFLFKTLRHFLFPRLTTPRIGFGPGRSLLLDKALDLQEK